jgi:outer membrane biosynthesis protein TonB
VIKPQLEANNRKFINGIKGGRPKSVTQTQQQPLQQQIPPPPPSPQQPSQEIIEPKQEPKQEQTEQEQPKTEQPNQETNPQIAITNNTNIKEPSPTNNNPSQISHKNIIEITNTKRNNREFYLNLDFIKDNTQKVILQKYIDYRKSIRKPLRSQQQLDICYKKLIDMCDEDNNIMENIVDNTIANGWQGLFPIKQNNGYNNRYNKVIDLNEYVL